MLTFPLKFGILVKLENDEDNNIVLAHLSFAG